MKRMVIVGLMTACVSPAFASTDRPLQLDSSQQPLVVARDDRPLGFLPPPPPLPGMDRDKVRERTHDMHRQQEIIDRYYHDDRRRGSYDDDRYERERYRDYDDDDHYRGKGKKGKKKKHLPPGLRKKVDRGGELPPGWQKKVARGEVLDRDLRRHCEDLPRDLRRELPPPPRGTKYLRLEDKIIRVVESTFEIIDVFSVGR